MEIKTTSCCGVKEFSGLRKDPVEVVTYFCQLLFRDSLSCAFILYTDPVEFEYGEALTDFIRNNKLGDVTETPEMLNPNSERMLKAYLFAPDRKELQKWWDKLPKPEPFKVGDLVMCNKSGHYSITDKGWIGKVVSETSSDGYGYIVVQDVATSGARFDVESRFFDLVGTPKPF